jgi:hypothetical protein
MVGVDPQLQPWEIIWVNDAATASNKIAELYDINCKGASCDLMF